MADVKTEILLYHSIRGAVRERERERETGLLNMTALRLDWHVHIKTKIYSNKNNMV